MTDEPNETPDQETAEPAAPESGAAPEGQAFDADYVRKLRDEAAKYRTAAKAATKELEDLRGGSKSLREELEAATAARDEALAARAAAELEQVRAVEASRHMIPADLIRGGTAEEVRAHAEALAKFRGVPGVPRSAPSEQPKGERAAAAMRAFVGGGRG